MIKPSVLMLDEPTAGVSPIVMDELFEHIIKVKKTNVAIIMVEQNAKQALSISDRGYVLVTGENKFEGSGKELLKDPEVRRSFLELNMDLLNAVIILLNYIIVPALTYGSQLALGAIFVTLIYGILDLQTLQLET